MPPSGWAAMQRIGEKSRRVAELWLSKSGRAGDGTLPISADLASDSMNMTQLVLANETQAEFWQDYLTLWQRTTQRLLWVRTPPSR